MQRIGFGGAAADAAGTQVVGLYASVLLARLRHEILDLHELLWSRAVASPPGTLELD